MFTDHEEPTMAKRKPTYSQALALQRAQAAARAAARVRQQAREDASHLPPADKAAKAEASANYRKAREQRLAAHEAGAHATHVAGCPTCAREDWERGQ